MYLGYFTQLCGRTRTPMATRMCLYCQLLAWHEHCRSLCCKHIDKAQAASSPISAAFPRLSPRLASPHFPLLPLDHCSPVEKPEGLTDAHRQTDRRSLPCAYSVTAHTQIREGLTHAGTKPPVFLCVQRKRENKGMHANALLCVHVGHQQTKEPIKQRK